MCLWFVDLQYQLDLEVGLRLALGLVYLDRLKRPMMPLPTSNIYPIIQDVNAVTMPHIGVSVRMRVRVRVRCECLASFIGGPKLQTLVTGSKISTAFEG